MAETASCTDHVWVTTGGGRLSRCRQCDLVATARPPEFEYQTQYFTESGAGGYDFEAAHARDFDAARFSDELDRLDRRGPRGSLLDIGCATGTFLCAAQARGWRVTGVEVAEYARVKAAERTRAEVFASCDDLAAERRFDVVTLHHVLEHIPHPVEFLRQTVRPRVTRRLLIEVPNFGSLASRVCGSRWRDLRLEQHISHFTHRTLASVVESAGLSVDRAYTLWEPLWSLRATAELGRLLLVGASGADRRWESGFASDGAGVTAVEAAAYTPPTGLRRVLTGATEVACRPLVLALESAGYGTRLVVEAVPR
jgi:SAM-dependent methyltransferase